MWKAPVKYRMGEGRSTVGPAIGKNEAHILDMFAEGGAVCIFRQYVRGIVLAFDFCESEIPGPDALLHPQIRHRKVADFAQSSSAANPNCRSSIREDIH